MYGDGQRGDHTHAFESVHVRGFPRSAQLFEAVEFVGVFGVGNELVDDAGHQNAAEKGCGGNEVPFGGAAGQLAQREAGFEEQFHE